MLFPRNPSSSSLALLVLLPLMACTDGPTGQDDSVNDIAALLEDDLRTLCDARPDATSLRLEAIPRGCDVAPCAAIVKGKTLECDADAFGDVKVRLVEPGIYVFELLYTLDVGEERECYAPSGQDSLEVPEEIDVPLVVTLEFRADGPCPA